jgi:hypothetical protein
MSLTREQSDAIALEVAALRLEVEALRGALKAAQPLVCGWVGFDDDDTQGAFVKAGALVDAALSTTGSEPYARLVAAICNLKPGAHYGDEVLGAVVMVMMHKWQAFEEATRECGLAP